MGWLAELFETNRIIVLSVYGQVFFVMGLAVALQSRRRSRLPLAGPLGWLAAFGIVHGFMEWGYLFVPIQAGFLPQPVIEGLLVLQLLLKPLSFALLFQFGVELLHQATRESGAQRSYVRWVPAAALLLWAVATITLSANVGSNYRPDARPWLPSAELLPALEAVGAPLAVGDVVARAMLALPGSLVVAIGLHRVTGLLGPAGTAAGATALRSAAIAFVVYAVVAGLVPLPAPFPPASVLNGQTVLDTLGVPIEVFRSLTGLAIAVAIIVSLEVFERETDRALADARRNELLARERERIGRDLHDGIIQSIYAAGLHLEQATAELDDDDAAETKSRIGTVMGELNRITNDIRGTIFDLRSGEVEARDAEAIILSVADELQAQTLVKLVIRSEGLYRPRLDQEQAEHLRHFVIEAFSNVLRHAHAESVTVSMRCTRRRFAVEIRDDGIGFDPTATATSRRGRAQGLANISRRAELLDADLDVDAGDGRGTTLSLSMPVATVRRSTITE
ncbi:MAG: ATP-binding protein [Chloroflexi bacterium]|nr:ATP-binding protein [Chloroflexota bacterium]